MNKAWKAFGIIVVWIGTCVLAYLFQDFGLLNGIGAAFMFIGAILCTCEIWYAREY